MLRNKSIIVMGPIGTLPDLRAQISAMAKAKGTTINEVAAEIGVSKQRLYSLLSGHSIYEEQVNGLLRVLCADPSELKMIPRDMLIPLDAPFVEPEAQPEAQPENTPDDEQPGEAAE